MNSNIEVLIITHLRRAMTETQIETNQPKTITADQGFQPKTITADQGFLTFCLVYPLPKENSIVYPQCTITAF